MLTSLTGYPDHEAVQPRWQPALSARPASDDWGSLITPQPGGFQLNEQSRRAVIREVLDAVALWVPLQIGDSDIELATLLPARQATQTDGTGDAQFEDKRLVGTIPESHQTADGRPAWQFAQWAAFAHRVIFTASKT